MMFPHTVTVYNKYRDGQMEKWQRTIIDGVFWDSIKGATVRKTGIVSADTLQLIIPMGAGASKRAYKAAKAWSGSINPRDKFWTLQTGDVVVKGATWYEVVKSSAELKDFDEVLTITAVDTKDFGGRMRHWEVTGR